MRSHVINMLQSLTEDGTAITDDAIIKWANQKVKGAGKNSTMSSFKDAELATSAFFFDLLYAVRKSAVNFEIVVASPRSRPAVRSAGTPKSWP